MTTDLRAPATPRAGSRRPLANRMVLRWLAGRTVSSGSLRALRYAARDGGTVVLPVMAAIDRDRITVLVAKAATKRWWRHFRTPGPVEVLIDGQWCAGLGQVGGPRRPEAPVHQRPAVTELPKWHQPLRVWHPTEPTQSNGFAFGDVPQPGTGRSPLSDGRVRDEP